MDNILNLFQLACRIFHCLLKFLDALEYMEYILNLFQSATIISFSASS